jgi:isocitrate dehydrogenase (NAD+)
MLLRHLGEQPAAERLEGAIAAVVEEGRTLTYDLGGTARTSQVADAVIARLSD